MSLKFQNILEWFRKRTNIINVLINEFKGPVQLENVSGFFFYSGYLFHNP